LGAGKIEFIAVEPDGAPDSSVILMHGLGADGHDFEPLVEELQLPESPAIRWVFPHAPVRPVTVNGGQRMRAWFDVTAINESAPEDEAGIRASSESIGVLIRAEREQGIPAERIILAGFSQGGAMALFTALRWPERLAGVLAMSCWLPMAASLAGEESPANTAVPLLMAHGTMDPLVPIRMAETTRDLLSARGRGVDWHTYPMAHGVCEQEIEDVRDWVLKVLGPAE
jgi:phospholipase/carboxylesterase